MSATEGAAQLVVAAIRAYLSDARMTGQRVAVAYMVADEEWLLPPCVVLSVQVGEGVVHLRDGSNAGHFVPIAAITSAEEVA